MDRQVVSEKIIARQAAYKEFEFFTNIYLITHKHTKLRLCQSASLSLAYTKKRRSYDSG